MDDNVFVSTRIPEIKIRVNSDFAYMGRFDSAEKAGFIKRQMYVFSAKNRAVASFFTIRISSITTSGINRDWVWRVPSQNSSRTLGGESYEMVFSVLNQKNFRWLDLEKIHESPSSFECVLCISFVREVSRKVMLDLHYFEDVSSMGYSEDEWRRPSDELTQEQRVFIEQLRWKKFMDVFTIFG